MMTDPIADLLTRIRNALAVQAEELAIPHSKLKERLVKLLIEIELVTDYSVEKADKKPKQLKLRLSDRAAEPGFGTLKRISRPGRRRYIKAADIPTVRGGRGVSIVSTSQGLMLGHQAYVRRLGGELICEIY